MRGEAQSPNSPKADEVVRARRSLALYGLLVAAGSVLFEVLLARTGDPIEKLIGLVFGIMWTPGVAAIICRLALREGIRDISLRWGGRQGWAMVGVAIVFPVVVGLVAYGAAWATGLDAFQPKAFRLGIPETAHPTVHFLAHLAFRATVGSAFGAVTALGEELGWRGYMLTRLFDARVPHPVLVSGLVWGLWHRPLILTGQYAAGPIPALSALVFVVSILAAAYVHAFVRMRSGSLWPALAAHGGWNSVIQGVFDAHTRGGGASRTASIWVGESGLLVAIVSIAIVLLVFRRDWTLRHHPREEPTSLGSLFRL